MAQTCEKFAAGDNLHQALFTNPQIFLETHILGTAVLMDACRKYGIERYHQVSTDEVYGDLPLERPDLFFHEDTPLHTSSPYSTSKASADLLVLAYHRTYGLPVTISRCSNNYGPYQFPEKLIPLMIYCYPAFYLAPNHATLHQIKKRHSINYSDGFFIRLLYAVPFVLS